MQQRTTALMILGILLGSWLMEWGCVPQLCDVDFECSGLTQHCQIGRCVQCLDTTHCPLGQQCTNGSCVQTSEQRPPIEPQTESGTDQPRQETAIDASEPQAQELPDGATPDLPVQEQSTDNPAQETATESGPRPESSKESSPGEPPLKDTPPSECQDVQSRVCYTGPASTEGKGECRRGVQQCVSGKWGKCEKEQLPTKEACDGKDNDCDGQIDEDNPDGGANCTTTGKGECGPGTQQCSGGKLSCVATNQPKTESCNGKDDDCDGQIDEGVPQQACYRINGSVCERGTTTCTNGKSSCTNTATHSCSSRAACAVCPGGEADYTCFIRLRRCILN